MIRNINCEGCGGYLGEIRDAKLKKGLVYLCSNCGKARKNSFGPLSPKERESNKGYSELKSIFGLDPF